MKKDYIDWEREAYERQKTRNEQNRGRRYRLALILAVVAWMIVLDYVLKLPASSNEQEPVFPKYQTTEELDRSWLVAHADLDKPAQEPDVVQYPLYDVPLSEALQEDLRCACNESGVDMRLALAVIKKETEFLNIYGDGGESAGYMQVQEKWHKERMARLGVDDLTDPLSNFRVGCDYLAELMESYTLEEALTAYNSGSPGTSQYAKTVMRYAEEINAKY